MPLIVLMDVAMVPPDIGRGALPLRYMPGIAANIARDGDSVKDRDLEDEQPQRKNCAVIELYMIY
jgi:hypothetical protein